jgi:hypothetical protein
MQEGQACKHGGGEGGLCAGASDRGHGHMK